VHACSPEGVTITPALIAVAPTIESTGSAAVNVEPVDILVKPPPNAPGK
jgi:hypothetical protein